VLRRLVVGLAIAVGIVASARAAVAGDNPRPAPGRWALGDAYSHEFGGVLRIDKSREFVTFLKIVWHPSGACGQTATVTGRFKIRSAPNFAGDRVWYIGQKTHGSATTPYNVTFHVGAKTYHGYIRGGFTGKTHGFGDFGYGNGTCNGQWKMHKS